ncbi:MAG: SdrD B-like domain-containing protein [Anaerolineae bacterium]
MNRMIDTANRQTASKPLTLMVRTLLVLAFAGALFLLPAAPIALAGNPDTPLDILYQAGTCEDPNYAIAVAGVGLNGATSGAMSLTIPATATVVQAYLFYVGYDSTDTSGGDPNITFQRDALAINPIVAIDQGGPAFWQTSKWAWAFRADVTSFIAAGAHTYTVAGLNAFTSPVLKTEGAELVVVYKDVSAGAQAVYLYAGMDMVQTRTGPPAGAGSIPVVVGPFDTASVVRTVKLNTIVGGGNLNPLSNESALWYSSGLVAPPGDIYGATLIANNPFVGAQGNYWDSHASTASLPIGDKVVAVQVESKDLNGAALEWIAQTVEIPLACPTVQVTKTLTSNSYVLEGGQATFRINVANTGNTKLTVVHLHDAFDTVHLNYNTANPTPNTFSEPLGTIDWTDLTGVAPNGFNQDLMPGQQFTVTVTFNAAVANGLIPVLNTANIITSTTKDENDRNPPPSTSTTQVIIVKPSILLEKTVTTQAGICPGAENLDVPMGSTVKYCYRVTNTGDTYLVNIVITDDKIPGTIGTIPGPLAPGATSTFVSATAVINADTLNTGTATGTPSTSGGTPLPNIPNVTDTDPANVRVTGKIGDFVWNDLNNNGIQDSGETGLPNVLVNLYANSTCTGTPSATQTTNASGFYQFINLLPGSYCVQVAASNFSGAGALVSWNTSPKDQGGDDTKDSDGDVSTHNAPVTLASGATDNTIDFGFWNPSSLGDFVWNDVNANGIQDSGEVGISNVKVNLYNNGTCTGTAQATTNTNASGLYSFTNLIPATYCVQVDSTNFSGAGVLLGWNSSPKDQGGDDTKDSDGDTVTHNSPAISLAAGANNPTIDFGFWNPSTLGDFVWNDINGNGIQDSGETGVSNVTVYLYNNGACTGSPINSTTTNASGAYSFTNLVPGTYCIEVASINFSGAGPLVGWNNSPKDAGGDDTKDSDGDVNHRSPALTVAAGTTNNTIDFGFWNPSSLGDYVWNDVNANGIQDGSEVGISGVTVNLYANGACTGSAQSSTTTNASGVYGFSNLVPGTYCVEVASGNFSGASVLVGWSSSPKDQGGDDTRDSDGDIVTHRSPAISLAAGTNNPTIDFGFWDPSSLGDFVWNDYDGDGIQDVGEPGLANVTVNLFANGTCTGAAQSTTTTNASGIYGFSSLVPGTYCVQIVGTNFSGAGVLVGFNSSPKDQGGDDTKDSDGDTITHNSPAIALPAGTDNPTIDFGFWKPGQIGDFVWNDINGNGVQDGGEVGIANATVRLYPNSTCTGSPQATTTTSPSGLYTFSNLPAGNYCIEVVTATGVLIGWNASPQDQGGDDTKDSDGNPITHIAPLVLAPAQTNTTIDFGFWNPSCLGDIIYTDSNGNGTQDGCADPNNPLSCAESTGISGVPIIVSGPNGFSASFLSGSSPAGVYRLNNLLPGTYTISVPAAISPNFIRTTASPRVITLTAGQCDLSVDFGYIGPTGINLQRFDAAWQNGSATLVWQTVSENGVDGFDIYRAPAIDGERERVNDALILVQGAGAVYTFVDTSAIPSKDYFYWLVTRPGDEVLGPWHLAPTIAPRMFFPGIRR